MTSQPTGQNPVPASASAPIDRRAAVAGLAMLVLLVLLAAGLVALVLTGNAGKLDEGAQAAPDPSSFAYAEAAPGACAGADRPGGQPVHARIPARPAGDGLLRLHALPGRLPGHGGHRQPGAHHNRRGASRRLRLDRPGAGRRRRHGAVRAVPAWGLRRAVGHAGGRPSERGCLGREVRAHRNRLRERLRDGPHGRHLPRGRAGHAQGALPVWDPGRPDRSHGHGSHDGDGRRHAGRLRDPDGWHRHPRGPDPGRHPVDDSPRPRPPPRPRVPRLPRPLPAVSSRSSSPPASGPAAAARSS